MKKGTEDNNKRKGELLREIRRIVLVVVASFIIAINIKSFIRAGNLIPGGFTGITLLIQQIGMEFLGVSIPFTLVNFLLNIVPAVISFKFIGRKFTGYSCLLIVLSGILTDILPGYPITDDILLADSDIFCLDAVQNALCHDLCKIVALTDDGCSDTAYNCSDRSFHCCSPFRLSADYFSWYCLKRKLAFASIL